MKRHIQNTRKGLTDLDGLAGETEKAERGILERAQRRMEEVDASLARLRPGLEAAPDSFRSRYEVLTRERGDLQVVIAKSQKALGQ
jgi:hypothetical protein